MKRKILSSLFLAFASVLFLSSKVFAVTLTLDQVPATITEQSFTISASVSGASAGQNFLRVDLYKDETTNYFGETYSGTSWYNGSSGLQYAPISISSSSGSASLQGRFGSPTTTEYDGTGTYRLRVRRYTSSGNSTSSFKLSITIIN